MGTDTRRAARFSARRQAALRCWLLACCFGFHVACVPYRLDLRIANACLRRRLPVFNQLPECLSRMHQRAPSRAQDARSLAHEKLEREKDLENCAAVL